MKKSIYCVGQKVIYCSLQYGRMAATVKEVSADLGKALIEYDNGGSGFVELSGLYPIEDYLDPTSYFYHHSRFGIFQARANDAFSGYMLSLEDFEQGIAQSDAAKAFLLCRLDGYEKAIQLNLALQRMAKINMGQWGTLTLEHHHPLVNPENVEGYKDA